MTIKLAENIRACRKQRALTQEQLAEVLGVTVGAVYKWEARLSQPELGMIVELADFFDTSVDALLGYEVKDNRLEATTERLKECRREKAHVGLSEAEKALKKYPNSFDIVYQSAALYRVFGLEAQEKKLLSRALELLEHARRLLPQNTDPKLGENVLYGEMAEVLLCLGEVERGVALLKKHNAGGLYSDTLGLTLAADCKRPDEALPYLKEALLKNVASLVRVVMGYLNVYLDRGSDAAAQEMANWGLRVFSGLARENTPCFLDKINGILLVCLAHAQCRSGDANAARDALRQAKQLAERFDAAPNYHADTLRFVDESERAGIYDNLGATAAESLQTSVESMENETLTALWKELNDREEA